MAWSSIAESQLYDSSDDNDVEPTATPGQDATIEQIREVSYNFLYGQEFKINFLQALKREQLRNQKLVQKNKDLRYAKDEVAVPSIKGRKPKSDTNIPAELADCVDQITRLGKKCAVMFCLWIPDEAFGQQRPSIDYTDPTRRYANARNKEMALIAELYDFVPEPYHAFLLGLPKFADIVCIAMFFSTVFF